MVGKRKEKMNLNYCFEILEFRNFDDSLNKEISNGKRITLFQHSACCRITASPIRIFKIAYCYTTTCRCVCEFIVGDINANMRNAMTRSLKENKVPLL